jgi:exopolysaccharide biosynthesis protein
MKKTTIFLLPILGLLAFFVFRSSSSPPVPVITPLPPPQASPPPIINTMATVEYADQLFHFSWVKIDQPQNLDIYPNFQAKSSTQELINQQNCSILVNGGFYGQDDHPIGWLVSQGNLVSQPVKSRLLNGYLSLINDQVSISAIRPQTAVTLGLQSGPLLVFDQKPLILKIKDDQARRRLIAAQTNNHQLIFLVIVGSDSLFTGPLLADTPAVVTAIGGKIGESLTAALNLDGGSASVFYTPGIYLEEFSWIGSYFCLH